MSRLFYACNIFVMPSFKEPLGLVFLEAMWSKCACIGTRTGSMPEFIDEGVTGYLVEPGDVAALAQRLIDLLGDAAGTRAMGEKGYLQARSYWNWDATVGRMLRVGAWAHDGGALINSGDGRAASPLVPCEWEH